MLANAEEQQIALDCASNMGLVDCVVLSSATPNATEVAILVQGMLQPPLDGLDVESLKAANEFLKSPFTLRVVIVDKTVIRHDWLQIQFS